MKAQRIWMFGIVSVLAFDIACGAAAEPAKPVKVNGHWSVMSVRVTLKSSKIEMKGLLMGTMDRKDGVYYSAHHFQFSNGEKSNGQVWLDTLEAVRETTDEGATLAFKNGTTREVRFGKEGSRCIILVTDNDGRETIELDAVKEVKFAGPARKDDGGHAMFDHWQYSPFTGQKLTPVTVEKK